MDVKFLFCFFKLKPKLAIFCILLIQSVFTILISMFIFFYLHTNNIKNNFILIKYANHNEFKINFDEIGLQINCDNLLTYISNINKTNPYKTAIINNFTLKKKYTYPEITINQNYLNNKLLVLASLINTPVIDADIALINNKIVKHHEAVGQKLNTALLASKIYNELKYNLNITIDLNAPDNGLVDTLHPKISESDLSQINQVIAKSTSKISPYEFESVRFASMAVNKVLVAPYPKNNEINTEFSFNKCLQTFDGIVKYNNEGYNQVASEIFNALLKCGISKDEMVFFKNPKNSITYEKYYPEIKILGNNLDFKFKNTKKHPIIIFTSILKDNLNVYIAG